MRWLPIAAVACVFLSGCGAVTLDSSCGSTDDCDTGEVCVDSTCVVVCTADLHCPSGTICDGEYCVAGERESEAPVEPQNEEPSSSEACDELGSWTSTCPALLPYTCPGAAIAQCVVDNIAHFSTYCAVETSGDPCAEGDIEYCTIRACYGDDYQDCLAEREVACACDHVEAEAGACVGYGYDCSEHSAQESWCFASVLESYDDPCLLFTEPDVRCDSGLPTEEGDASCRIQECFGIATYVQCREYLEVECIYSP